MRFCSANGIAPTEVEQSVLEDLKRYSRACQSILVDREVISYALVPQDSSHALRARPQTAARPTA